MAVCQTRICLGLMLVELKDSGCNGSSNPNKFKLNTLLSLETHIYKLNTWPILKLMVITLNFIFLFTRENQKMANPSIRNRD